MLGVNSRNVGLLGVSNGTGVIALGGAAAGTFFGNTSVTGILSKGGGFTIDYPADPANRYLRHSFVESAEMKNLYGIAVCDGSGEAEVFLPDWFEPLNTDVRYQLSEWETDAYHPCSGRSLDGRARHGSPVGVGPRKRSFRPSPTSLLTAFVLANHLRNLLRYRTRKTKRSPVYSRLRMYRLTRL